MADGDLLWWTSPMQALVRQVPFGDGPAYFRPALGKRVRAAIERFLAPGYSTCKRCRRPWKYVEPHLTKYTTGRSCFPLCEACWRELGTPAARMPYYVALYGMWCALDRDHAKWSDIHDAVASGG